MAKNIDEVLTDCTLCYHSRATRLAIEDGAGVIAETDRGQVKMKANGDERVAEGAHWFRTGGRERPMQIC